MPKQFIQYGDFSGGLQTDVNDDNFAPNELRIAKNVDLSTRGAAVTRQGIRPLNETSYNAKVLRTFKWKRKNGDESIMAVFFTESQHSLQKINKSTGEATFVVNLESNEIAWEVWQDRFYFIDGGQFRYYDGYSTKPVRLDAPVVAPTIGNSGTGSFTGTYKFMAVFVNELGIESLASPEATATVTSKAQFDWSGIPIGDANCVSRKLYRTAADGEVFKLVTTLIDNTTTTYTDTTADGDLGADYDDLNDLAPIKKCTLLKRHPTSGRFFAGGNPDDIMALYWSEPNAPGVWKAISLYYPTTAGGRMLNIDMFDKAVVVQYENGPYVWKGTDPDTNTEWGPLPIGQGIGGKGLSTLALSALAFVNSGGIFEINPMILTANNAVFQGGDVFAHNAAKDKLTKEFLKIANFDKARIAYDWVEDKLLLACSESNSTDNNKVIVYWKKLGAFSIYTGWIVHDWIVMNDGTVMFGSDDYIYRTKQGYDDNGTAIDFELETAWLSLNAPKIWKLMFKIYFYLQQVTGKATMDVKVHSETDEKQLDPIIFPSGFFWNSNYKWNSSVGWGGSQVRDYERKCRNKGNRFKVNIKNQNIGEKITLYGIGFMFRPTKPKGRRK